MKKTTEEYYRIISYLYDNPRLPADVHADFDRWMLCHADDNDAIEAMQTLWNRNFGHSDRNVDNADLISFMTMLNNKIASEKKPAPGRHLLRYAAAVAVFLVSSVLIFLAGTTMAPEVTSLATADGSVGRYTLPDGSTVVLNANSRLTYTKGGIAGSFRRKVELEGEAYFDVVRDSSHPFTVDISDATVRVLGTSFDVRSYAGSGTTEVVLLKGKVSVTPKYESRRDSAVTLTPGMMLSIGRNNGQCTVTSVNATDYCQWHTPRIKLENKTLSAVLVNIGRRYCLDLDLDTDLDLDRRLTLTLSTADDIDQTMAVIARIAGIEYSITGSTLHIKPNTNLITKQQ